MVKRREMCINIYTATTLHFRKIFSKMDKITQAKMFFHSKINFSSTIIFIYPYSTKIVQYEPNTVFP